MQRFLVAFLMGFSLLVAGDASAGQWSEQDKVIYAACYAYTNGPSAGYLPIQKMTGKEAGQGVGYQSKARTLWEQKPELGYETVTCQFSQTEAGAVADRIKTGYVNVGDIQWPKGFAQATEVHGAAQGVAETKGTKAGYIEVATAKKPQVASGANAEQEASAARSSKNVAKAEADKRKADSAAKAIAKPVAKRSIRGFLGKNCEHARQVATSQGTFVETAHEISPKGSCIVQGWYTPNPNAAPRQ